MIPARAYAGICLAAVLAAGLTSLAGCARPAKAVKPSRKRTAFTYPWTVLRAGKCQGIALMDNESVRAHDVPAQIGDSTGEIGFDRGTVYFYFLAPIGVDARHAGMPPTPLTKGQVSAKWLRKDGQELPALAYRVGPNPRGMEVALEKNYARSDTRVDLAIDLPDGDRTVFRLDLPPRDDLPAAAIPAASPVLQHEELRLSGEAWLEPSTSDDKRPIFVHTLRAQGGSDPLKVYELREWAWKVPDRELAPPAFRQQFAEPTSASSWAVGYAEPVTWLSDPPILRSYGTVDCCLVQRETTDFGKLPTKLVEYRNPHLRNLLAYTLAGPPVIATTQSGMEIEISAADSGLVPLYGTDMGPEPRLYVRLRLKNELKTGLNPLISAAGEPTLEISRLGPSGAGSYRRCSFEANGFTQESFELADPRSPVMFALSVRRKSVVEQIPFSLCVPIGHRGPAPSGWTRGTYFDPDRKIPLTRRSIPVPPALPNSRPPIGD